MRKIKILSVGLLLLWAGVSVGQELKFKRNISLRNAVLTDSASTLMIPVDLHELASSKSVDVNYTCANLIFYNFNTDSSFKLFEQNTCIMFYQTYDFDFTLREIRNRNILRNWILYRVKNVDSDKNGKIDSGDPDILYCSDIHGGNLRQLTTAQENVVSIEVYHEQSFALITLQADMNQDGNYDKDDRQYSYVKLDLATLTLGKKIESN